MAWISRTVTIFGAILLAHACYSAREHATIQAHRLVSTQPTTHPQPAAHAGDFLPLDISVETIAATIIVCLGVVFSVPGLRPIQWQVWASKLEREDGGGSGISGEAGAMNNPFKFLENRPGFVDIRAQRRVFEEWVKNGGDGPA